MKYYKKEEQKIYPPKGGWKRLSWYLVEVSFNKHNPVHHRIFYTGFLDYKGYPQGYNTFATDEARLEICNVYYMKAIRLLVGEKELDKECSRWLPDEPREKEGA